MTPKLWCADIAGSNDRGCGCGTENSASETTVVVPPEFGDLITARWVDDEGVVNVRLVPLPVTTSSKPALANGTTVKATGAEAAGTPSRQEVLRHWSSHKLREQQLREQQRQDKELQQQLLIQWQQQEQQQQQQQHQGQLEQERQPQVWHHQQQRRSRRHFRQQQAVTQTVPAEVELPLGCPADDMRCWPSQAGEDIDIGVIGGELCPDQCQGRHQDLSAAIWISELTPLPEAGHDDSPTASTDVAAALLPVLPQQLEPCQYGDNLQKQHGSPDVDSSLLPSSHHMTQCTSHPGLPFQQARAPNFSSRGSIEAHVS